MPHLNVELTEDHIQCYLKFEVDEMANRLYQLLSQPIPDIENSLILLNQSFDIEAS